MMEEMLGIERSWKFENLMRKMCQIGSVQASVQMTANKNAVFKKMDLLIFNDLWIFLRSEAALGKIKENKIHTAQWGR